MKHPQVETFNSAEFLDRYAQPAPFLQAMPQAFAGAFMIVAVQDMLRASRLPVPPIRSAGHTLILLSEGEANMKIGYQPYRITRHQCLVVAAGTVFSYEQLEHNAGHLIHFSEDFLVGHHGKAELLQTFDFLNVWGHPVLTLLPDQVALVGTLLGRLQQVFKENGLRAQSLCQAHLLALLQELALASAAAPARAPKGALLSNRFLELLFQHFRQIHRVHEYADRLAVSPNHLHKVVKEATGKPPSKWIDEVIVLEARVLLFQTHLPVATIALQLGIEDNSYFSRLFKRHEGITPVAFRKRMESSHSS